MDYKIMEEKIKGTYVKFIYDYVSCNKLFGIQSLLKLENFNDDFHTTLVYSRKPINFSPEVNLNHQVIGTKLDIFESNDGTNCVVLKLKLDEYLSQRFLYSKLLGATWDYPDYQPHITLSYNEPNLDHINTFLNSDLDIKLTITDEIVEELEIDE